MSDKTGAGLIAAERQRQIEQEGWDAAHDDIWTEGQLSQAASFYIGTTQENLRKSLDNPRHWGWPFADGWFKPLKSEDDVFPEVDRKRCLVKAGALIAAEIDRLERQEQRFKESKSWTHDQIREAYYRLHRRCPKCLGASLETTCIGSIFTSLETARDPNRAICDCGWTGIVHDLVPEAESEPEKEPPPKCCLTEAGLECIGENGQGGGCGWHGCEANAIRQFGAYTKKEGSGHYVFIRDEENGEEECWFCPVCNGECSHTPDDEIKAEYDSVVCSCPANKDRLIIKPRRTNG